MTESIRPDPIIAATAKRRLLLDFTEPSRNSIKRGRGGRSRCIASHCMALHCRMQVGRWTDSEPIMYVLSTSTAELKDYVRNFRTELINA